MAVELKFAKPKKMPRIRKDGFVAGNVKMVVAARASADALGSFLKANIALKANLFSDG